MLTQHQWLVGHQPPLSYKVVQLSHFTSAHDDSICQYVMMCCLQAWMALDQAKKYPTTEGCMPYQPSKESCSPDCSDTDPDLKLGYFTYRQLTNIWEIQEWIRLHGSTLTRINIFSDLRPFFEKNPNAIYMRPGEGISYAA